MSNELESFQQIPKQIEIYGRTIKVLMESEKLGAKSVFGEARYGENAIHLNPLTLTGNDVSADEIKLTFIHEMLHFILNFTGLQKQLEDSDFDLEQFIELLSAGIYQYEKSAKY